MNEHNHVKGCACAHQCRQRGSKQQHQRKLFFRRTCQRLSKLKLRRMFHQWAQLVGTKLQKQANATHIASHRHRQLQVCLYTHLRAKPVYKLRCVTVLWQAACWSIDPIPERVTLYTMLLVASHTIATSCRLGCTPLLYRFPQCTKLLTV